MGSRATTLFISLQSSSVSTQQVVQQEQVTSPLQSAIKTDGIIPLVQIPSTLPVKELSFNMSTSNDVSNSKSSGTVPVNWFRPSSKNRKFGNSPSCRGKGPVSPLLCKSKSLKFLSEPISVAMASSRPVSRNDKSFKSWKLPIHVGMGPGVNSLLPRKRYLRLVSSLSRVGMSPAKTLEDKSKCVKLFILAMLDGMTPVNKLSCKAR
mmetsp:Transcript_9052/g.16402  ORF Transcript_9052/g.16402 Transcript_9052/m.16402 type:complete len:207 (-) Transcript_9052:1013-1633(-)